MSSINSHRMTIKEIIMERDRLTDYEADTLIADAKDALDMALSMGDTDQAEDICMDYFSLESDYIMELLD